MEREPGPRQESKIYLEDGRKPVEQLDRIFSGLEATYNWKKIFFFFQTLPYSNKSLPVFFYTSPLKGPAIWLLGGIHGEESAPPNAYAQNVDAIGSLGKEIPMVVGPLLSPCCYQINRRYPRQENGAGLSIADPDHILPHLENPLLPRRTAPSSNEAATLIKKILDLMSVYPPILVYDGHEDLVVEEEPPVMASSDQNPHCYIYSQGIYGPKDPIAQKITEIFTEHVFPLVKKGETRFPHEIVKNGIVFRDDGQPIRDGSLEEFFAAGTIFQNGRWIDKKPAPHVITGETTINGHSFSKRVDAHSEVIQSLPEFLKTIK